MNKLKCAHEKEQEKRKMHFLFRAQKRGRKEKEVKMMQEKKKKKEQARCVHSKKDMDITWATHNSSAWKAGGGVG